MIERRFYFPDEAVEIAEESGIAEIAEKLTHADIEVEDGGFVTSVYTDYRITHEEEIDAERHFFKRSQGFELLTDDEKVTAQQAFFIDSSDTWKTKGATLEADDRLFPVQAVVGKVACTKEDKLTLSGAGAFGFTELAPGLFDRFEQYGFQNRLAFMQFAGAWLCNLAGYQIDNPEIDFADVKNHGMRWSISMGGHMHGDFRMQEILIPEFGSITPFGSEVRFAPIEERAQVAAYHSSEKSIVTAICAYVMDDDSLSYNEKRHLFEVLLSDEKSAEQPQRGASFYGDFGGDDRTEDFMKLDLDVMRCNGVNGLPYLSTMVFPGREDIRLIAQRTQDGDFELTNNHTGEAVRLSALNVPSLLLLFTKIGQAESRTSVSSIRNAIRCAQQTFLRNEEPGSVLYKQD